MKKTLAKLLAIATLLTSLQAHALVGFMAGDDDMVVAGAVMIDISSITVVDRDVYYRPGRRVAIYTYRTLTYLPLALFGLFVLDENGNRNFQELSNAKASELGISESEMNAYNSELEEVNAVKDMIVEDVASLESNEDKMQAIGQAWNESAEVLSTDALSAVQKISAQLQK